MKQKVVCAVLVSVLLLSTMLLTEIQKVEAEGTTVVYVDPETSYATVGQTFKVNVSIANVTDLYGFELKLGYNTTILDIAEAIIQPFLNEPTVVIKNEIYEDWGWYWLAIASLPPALACMHASDPKWNPHADLNEDGIIDIIDIIIWAIHFGETL